MTEKRFTHRKWYNERQLFDGDEPFAIVDVYNQAETICNKLNELADENEQLKQQNRELQGELQDEKLGLNLWNAENTILEEEKKQLQKENKELKQRIGGLEDYKEASIKFTQEVEDFFKRHEFDTVNFDLIDIIFDGFEFYSDKCDELKKENKELKYKNSQLQETLAFRSNQLALMERLVDDLGSEEMARQMEEILND